MPKKRCYICDSSVINDLELGEFQDGEKNISVHYYCLLVTSNLVQNGEDDEGILGFLTEDIEAEVERIKRLKCYYCKKSKANIGCCVSRCRRTFHTLCGIKNDALLQFEDPYKGFCHDHIPKSKIKRKHTKTEQCTICFDEMGSYHKINSILLPCCKTHWFHKICLMQLAKSAGYFFKCPLCNNSDKFREQLKLMGIFVPDRDAQWELEPNAFAELQEDDTCQAKKCLCPNGRDWDESEFSISRCTMCGYCFHIQCSITGTTNSTETICDPNDFICNACVRPAEVIIPQSSAIQNDDESTLSCRVQTIEPSSPVSSSSLSSTSSSLSAAVAATPTPTATQTTPIINSHRLNTVERIKTEKDENLSLLSRNKQQGLKNSTHDHNQNKNESQEMLFNSLINANMSTLSDVEIIENKVELIYVSSTSSDDDYDDDDNLPLLTRRIERNDSNINITPKKPQITKLTKKRRYPESPKKIVSPPVINRNKKIKKTIEICKNQSKITSFFTTMGSKSSEK